MTNTARSARRVPAIDPGHVAQRLHRRHRVELADVRRDAGRHEALLDLDRRDVQPQRRQIVVAQRRVFPRLRRRRSRRAATAAATTPAGSACGGTAAAHILRAGIGSRNCRTRRSSRCRRPPPCGPGRRAGSPPGCRPAAHASSGSRRTARAPGRSPRLRCGTAGTAAAPAAAHRPAAPRRSVWRRVSSRCASSPPAHRRPATGSMPPAPAIFSSTSAPARQPSAVSSQARCTKQRSCSLVRK